MKSHVLVIVYFLPLKPNIWMTAYFGSFLLLSRETKIAVGGLNVLDGLVLIKISTKVA